MSGLIGKKIGMTSIFNDAGKNIACTVVETGGNVITQIKSEDSDGYASVQIAYGDAKDKNTTQPLAGHFKKAGVSPKKKVVEFRDGDFGGAALGAELKLDEVLVEGDIVNVIGVSKGKGFQGVVKRHGFHGVGDATHGQHNRLRAPGSIGAASYPAKVFKGMRMGGRDGGKRVKTTNLKIVKLFPEKNLVLIGGAIPGHKGAFVIIEK